MSGDTLEFTQGTRDTLRGTLHDPAATTGHVLTVQADKSIKAKPGGGGGSGPQVVTVPVSSAQILDLANTPVVLIPGVAGKVTAVNGVGIAYVAGLVPYLDGGGNLSVDQGVATAIAAIAGAGFWDQATSQIYLQGYGNLGAGAVTGLAADVVLTETVANPTDGDGTLLVTLSYFLAPTV